MGASASPSSLVWFGPFELDLRSRELRRASQGVTLQAQPFLILRRLLEQAGQVVTRDELRRLLWPDGTFVDYEHSLNAAMKRLRSALADDSDKPQYVETLIGRGYRFVGQLHPTRPPWSGASSRAAHGSALRVAVLPFLGDPADEDFNRALMDELIFHIGQLGSLGGHRIAVVARMSSMVFKGAAQRAKEIGESLDADFLLEGSVRRRDDRARITAWLVDARAEVQTWRDAHECDLRDRFASHVGAAQRIAEGIVAALADRSLHLHLHAQLDDPLGGQTEERGGADGVARHQHE